MYEQSFDVIEFVLAVGLPSVLALALGALAAFAGEQAVNRFWALWRALRRHVDQPSDPAVLVLALVYKALAGRVVDPAQLSAAILKVYDEVSKSEG